MAISRTAFETIGELREFAGFSAQEQFFIECSLDIGRGRCAADARDDAAGACLSWRRLQRIGYEELQGLRGGIRAGLPLVALDGFFAALVRVSALDLARGDLSSFAAYRFLYERLFGAGLRPYLPASFCAAAALPQIEPARRRLLLASVQEAVVTAPLWSERAPVFMPGRLLDEPACDQ